MNLENKVVLVTGSSGGLGAQICYEAAKKRCHRHCLCSTQPID